MCLVPFCGKAFHIDDTLFLWAAQHIVRHPLDPYGFSVVWYWEPMPMANVTKNPPAAAYYMAAVGKVAGFSEPVMHLAFLLPALVVVLGTYRLARGFTGRPLLAAAATLLAPGFLVSSTDVMCDTMMLAAWILAVMLWREGLEGRDAGLLALAGVLVAVCAVTKYFGIALIPLLLIYSFIKTRRLGSWVVFLAIPVLVLAGYQYGSSTLYGRGLFAQAVQYAPGETGSAAALAMKTVLGLSFAGGCALPVLTFVPVVWRWRGVLATAAIAGAVGVWAGLGPARLTLQLCVFIAGGISLFALAVSDFRKRRDADSALLGLWVLGTFAFAAYVNWTVNARSVLPLIPAAGILLARRVESMGRMRQRWLVAALAVSGFVAMWVSWADARLADSARLAARMVASRSGAGADVSFEGHWGFQYYMERLGFRPVDFASYRVGAGKTIVIPENNCNLEDIPPEFVESDSGFELDTNVGVSTMSDSLGAGFYSDVSGPLPFAFGRVPAERYTVVRLKGQGLLDPEARK
jgi:4-amino-4-deoxy-L-arabinose transferase-like glycosyltransferase